MVNLGKLPEVDVSTDLYSCRLGDCCAMCIFARMKTSFTLKTRRTVRAYTDKALDQALLDDLLESAFRASNTGNMQAYAVIVTRDQARKEAMAPMHFNQPQVKQAPVVLTFCVDFNRITRWCEQRQAEPGFDTVQSFTYGAIDTIIAAQAFCAAAEDKGLGICYLGTTTYNAGPLCELLELPPLVVPLTTITVGYPTETAMSRPLSDRLPMEAVVHEEVYHDFTPEIIDRVYGPKEALPENQQFVTINQRSTLAQVYAGIRYTKADNQRFSQAWIEVLRKQGYLD
jgi:FMN reductase [NAD(P)H]